MEFTDEELIGRCRDGDDAAWENLIRRYRRLIFAIPRRAGLDEDASGEVFQQVFTLLVQYLDGIKDASRIQAWLVTTARRETLAFLRKQSRIQQLKSSAEIDDGFNELANLPDERILPDEALEQIETHHRVRTAVESLDEKCRALLEMLFYRDTPPPYSQIAETLRVSEGSIGPTRARCLKKVLDVLDG